MRQCKKCGNDIPKSIVVNGRRRNLQNRWFCLDCSPFGDHNTRTMFPEEKGNEKLVHVRVCTECGRQYNSANRKGSQCFSCYFNRKMEKRSNAVYSIVGEKCWKCGYDHGKIGRRVLCFHHIDPNKKLFELTTRDFVGKKWDVVVEEMKKCALLCVRCHVEFHAGILTKEEIEGIYFREWMKIGQVV